MLAVSQLTSRPNNGRECEIEMESFSMEGNDLSSGNLLDSIDFDDFFPGIGDGDLLPDLEMDPEILLADFSANSTGEEESEFNIEKSEEKSWRKLAASSDLGSGSSNSEIESNNREKPPVMAGKGGRKSSSHSKNALGKRKVKVDWTPELHRRFVQAVEQLGVDKAVPSRILELMGIDCLTRHNIASHLQKYRSHRKHLLAREAEAASWSHRRQMYGGGGKRDHVNTWITPTMGFPPPPPHFRPLHVWGHPSADQSLMHMWPKHLAPPPPHTCPPTAHPQPPPPPPPADPSFWVPHHQQHVAATTPGAPYYPPHMPHTTRFPTPPVHGIPPPAMYKVESAGLGVPSASPGQTLPQPPSHVHPTKESLDAAIGDVLSKPWLPLPLGLKPPSIDSVVVELQRQGISKIPPTCA